MPNRWAWIAAGLAMCARGSPQGDLSNTIPTALRGFSCVVPHSDVVTPLGRMMYPSGGGGGEPPPIVNGVIPPEFGWLVGEITLQECVDLCASWETVRTRIDSTHSIDHIWAVASLLGLLLGRVRGMGRRCRLAFVKEFQVHLLRPCDAATAHSPVRSCCVR
jgi:hypothetical protein